MIKINIRKALNLAGGKGQLHIDTELDQHSFCALYGPSGAGKTTLLRIIAGLLKPEEGIIEVNGETWLNTAKNINISPQKRDIGFVFQDYALFPNMTVKQNLLFALSNKDDVSYADELLRSMDLESLSHQKPELLSGGQKQRVALARAIIRKPKLLLLDEPLSALDDAMRINLQQQLQKVHQQYGLTTLLVSHHIPEIYRLAQHVLHIENGQLIRRGTPAEVFGIEQGHNILLGEVVNIDAEKIEVMIGHNIITLPNTDPQLAIGDKVTIHAADLSLKKLS